MSLVIACGALAIAALLYIFWVTPEPIRKKSALEREREFLNERKEVVYEGLRDLQMEYRMGKLSDADYQELKLTYQRQLAELLDEATRLGLSEPVTTERSVPTAGRCPRCGHHNPPANRFCGACGASLSPKEVTA